MTEGELLQLTLLGQADVSEAHYLDVLKRKTAYLFSASCEIGSILGGATETEQTALRDYGMNLGIAFQLIDDLLDFTADEAALGKAAGADLLGGKVTLPLIYLRDAEPSTLTMIQQVLSDRSYKHVSQQDLLDAMGRTDALQRARATADEYADNARLALEYLPESDYCDALRTLPTYILNRDR
jgi:octaprenyl-diphosphate synthase